MQKENRFFFSFSRSVYRLPPSGRKNESIFGEAKDTNNPQRFQIKRQKTHK
jgi:hypothetical protein